MHPLKGAEHSPFPDWNVKPRLAQPTDSDSVVVVRGRLEKDSPDVGGVIQAWDVDRTESWPDGRHRQEDQALSV